jgi:methionine synthase II (cobalamin-independent)
LNETLETKTSDKRDWYKDNQLSEEELKQMLEEKLKRVMTYKVVYPVRKK